jgi:hypothetical protein
MIQLSREDWFELREACLDDSAGPIDDPEFDVVIDAATGTAKLYFVTPQAETAWCLRWIK